MKRNRNRKRCAHWRLMSPGLAGGLVLIVTLGCLYGWMHVICMRLGQQVKKLEQQDAELQKECLREQNRWATLKLPQNLDQALVRHGLSMPLPRAEQIARLTPARATAPAGYHERERLAAGTR